MGEEQKKLVEEKQKLLYRAVANYEVYADRKHASLILKAAKALSDEIRRLEVLADSAAFASECLAEAANRLSDTAIRLWHEKLLVAYETPEYPSNKEWSEFVDRSSDCLVLIEEGLNLTRDAVSEDNIGRYEAMLEIHMKCIETCGWSYDMHGSNVSMSNTLGRSWHKDKQLPEKEQRERIRRITAYEARMAAMRSELADREIKEEKERQEQYFKEHPDEYEAYRENQKKQAEQSASLIAEGEQYEQQGEKLQAALCYWKAKDWNRARETFDFRNLIGAGQSHTVGLMPDGRVLAVGDSLDSKGNDLKVCKVSGWKNIIAVDAANFSTIGLRSNGMIAATGVNVESQLNVSLWRENIGISAGNRHTLALRKDGAVLAIGANKYKQCRTQGWKNVVEVSAGVFHSLARMADGTVKAVGAPDEGRLATEHWHDIVMIAAGGGHSVGLLSNGTVVACGQNDKGQCNVQGWRDIVSIAAGTLHTIGIRADGTVVACGDNERGQCNVGEWTDIIAATCSNHTVGLCANGRVVCAGDNAHGQNATEQWNLFSKKGFQRKTEMAAHAKPMEEELERLKDEYRKTNVLNRKKRKTLWEQITQLEERMNS